MYDYQAANTAKMDFIFISEWTEVGNWKEWSKKQNIVTVNNISSLVIKSD